MSEDNQDNQDNEDIKRLREKAKAADQVPELQKKLAFVEAGIKYDKGPAALLFKSYDGELTAEAVLAAATEFGIVGAQPEESTDPTEQSALEQIQQVTQSTDSGGEGLGVDPYQQAREALEKSRQAGEPVEWQHAAAISRIVAADNRNDPRVKGKSNDDYEAALPA